MQIQIIVLWDFIVTKSCKLLSFYHITFPPLMLFLFLMFLLSLQDRGSAISASAFSIFLKKCTGSGFASSPSAESSYHHVYLEAL